MAKSELTLEIEETLYHYYPVKINDIEINKFRGCVTAFEVPAECGTNAGGIIDCVKVNEYFGDMIKINHCGAYYWDVNSVTRLSVKCPLGLDNKNLLPFCKNDKCQWHRFKEIGTPKILIQCYEIKISKADFMSKNGHNFVGNFNFYVVPTELYPEIKGDIPDEIGVILYKNGKLRRVKNPVFIEMPDEKQKWMLLDVLKRVWRS